MMKARGIFDGKNIVLLEPVNLPADTAVEVTIQEHQTASEEAYWQRLRELGLITTVAAPDAPVPPYTPVQAQGAPVSQTIIEERR